MEKAGCNQKQSQGGCILVPPVGHIFTVTSEGRGQGRGGNLLDDSPREVNKESQLDDERGLRKPGNDEK